MEPILSNALYCETLTTCSGSITDDYTVEINLDTGTYTCSGVSECSRNRCECDSSFTTMAMTYLKDEEDAGTLSSSLQTSHMNVEKSQCRDGTEKLAGGQVSVKDACCGNAPTWIWYNTSEKTCTNGLLT